MELSIIVPTYNEAPNIEQLLRRLEEACHGIDAEVIFVDDSRDETPETIRREAARSALPVNLIHRVIPSGGLGGAVIDGIRSSDSVYCLVMDGDLQHPPELIPAILASLRDSAADVVVASRYCGGGGDAGGLANGLRRLVSSASTLVTRTLFPLRLRKCTDPMTGFFGLRRSAIDIDELRPNGFKILLEILGRERRSVAEVPFIFAERHAGESKASVREGWRFMRQLAILRFGRIAGFAVVGGIGAILNLLIMWAFIAWGMHYLMAAVIAAETTIVGNFLLQEHMVFHRSRAAASPLRTRFLQSFAYNNMDAALRLPLLWLLVELAGFTSLLAQAGTLAAAFLVRYLFHARIVYRAVTSVDTSSGAHIGFEPTSAKPRRAPRRSSVGDAR